MEQKPIFFVFAGPNGAGKTSYLKYLKNLPFFKNAPSANFDRIYKYLTEKLPKPLSKELEYKTQNAASRIVKAILKNSFAQGRNVSIETTGAARSVLSEMRKAKENGFAVVMFYTGLSDAQKCINRVQERVSKGGHNVQKEVILQRYLNGLKNLPDFFIHADATIVIDNSGREPHPIFIVKNKEEKPDEKEILKINKVPAYLEKFLKLFTNKNEATVIQILVEMLTMQYNRVLLTTSGNAKTFEHKVIEYLLEHVSQQRNEMPFNLKFYKLLEKYSSLKKEHKAVKQK